MMKSLEIARQIKGRDRYFVCEWWGGGGNLYVCVFVCLFFVCPCMFENVVVSECICVSLSVSVCQWLSLFSCLGVSMYLCVFETKFLFLLNVVFQLRIPSLPSIGVDHCYNLPMLQQVSARWPCSEEDKKPCSLGKKSQLRFFSRR